MSPDKNFDIIYVADGGRPPVSARLQISPAGEAELYLGSTWSLPGGSDTVGFFKGQLSPNELKDLNQHLHQHRISERPAGPPPASPDATTRYLVLNQGSQQTQLTLVDTSGDPPLARLEETFAGLMRNLVQQPARAVQVTLTAAPGEAGSLQPTVTFRHLGPDPLPVLLYEAKEPNTYLRATLEFISVEKSPTGSEMVTPHQAIPISRDQIAALAGEGLIPSGIQQMSGETSYTITLPPVEPPPGDEMQLSGTFAFWLPGSGPERRLVHVQPQRVPLNE